MVQCVDVVNICLRAVEMGAMCQRGARPDMNHQTHAHALTHTSLFKYDPHIKALFVYENLEGS